MPSIRRTLAVGAAALVVASGALLATAWAPDRPVAAVAARWAPPPSRLDTIGGMLVHLRDEGPRDDSLPIVLLHGTSSSLHTWEGWVRELRTTRRVVTLDLPGFALTDPFADGDYTAAHYVAFTMGVLEALGVPRAIVGGNSFGGQVAWQLAVNDSARVAGLVLVDAVAFPPTSTSVPIGFRLARLPVLDRVVGVLLPRGVVESSVRDVFGDPTRVTDAIVDRYYDLARREGNRAALVRRLRHGGVGADSTPLARLHVPTLILWGGRDRLIPPDHGERLHRAIRGSRLVRFDELGHVPQEEDPARSLVPVRAFLDSISPRPAVARGARAVGQVAGNCAPRRTRVPLQHMTDHAPRPWVLAEQPWPAVRDAGYEVAVLPWGATEAHNTHLPYATDSLQCDVLAAESARRAWERGARVVVLPTVPFGVNTTQLDIPLTLNLNPSTQLAVLRDLVSALEGQGIRKLVLFNGHGGNDFKAIIRELHPTTRVLLCTLNWWQVVDPRPFFTDLGDHAGELETSVMQHVAPSLVRPLDEAGDGAARPWRIAAFREGWAWAPRQWTRVTADTGIGDPRRATATAGARFAEAACDRIAGFLVELAAADPADLYA